MYSIGSDFCIEDPVQSPFQATVLCHLENEPQPPPEFYWILYYNDTDHELDAVSTGLQIFNKSDNVLTLSGTIELGEDVLLTIACYVENQYGNDTENTTISLCGEKMYNHVTTLYFLH